MEAFLKRPAGEVFFPKKSKNMFSHQTNLAPRSNGNDIFTSTKYPRRFEILIKNPNFSYIGCFFFFFKYTVGEDHACELFQKVAAKDKISPQSWTFLFYGYHRFPFPWLQKWWSSKKVDVSSTKAFLASTSKKEKRKKSRRKIFRKRAVLCGTQIFRISFNSILSRQREGPES